MNWYKAKTILIVFLIIVNALLFAYISYDNAVSLAKEEKVIGTVISLMEKKGITVEKELVLEKSKNKSIKAAYAENIITDYNEFSKLILGENTVKNSENSYSSEVGTITFNDNRFLAVANKPNVLKEYKTDKNNFKKNVVDYCSFLGIDTKNIDINLLGNEDEFIATITKSINSHPVFSREIKLVFSTDGIVSAEGIWYLETENDNSEYELKNISSILADYMNSAPQGSKITSITLGYSTLDDNVFYKNVSFIPVWEIKNDLDNVQYIDARE